MTGGGDYFDFYTFLSASFFGGRAVSLISLPFPYLRSAHYLTVKWLFIFGPQRPDMTRPVRANYGNSNSGFSEA